MNYQALLVFRHILTHSMDDLELRKLQKEALDWPKILVHLSPFEGSTHAPTFITTMRH